jgi:hypothetical protein
LLEVTERAPKLNSLLAVLIATNVISLVGLYSIVSSSSSTAAIGFLFLPFYLILINVITFSITYAISKGALYIGLSIRRHRKRCKRGVAPENATGGKDGKK